MMHEKKMDVFDFIMRNAEKWFQIDEASLLYYDSATVCCYLFSSFISYIKMEISPKLTFSCLI